MPAVRRLAAILAADVAGYSRLMGADEEGTHEQLKVHRRELIDLKIAAHRGRIVKTSGDGILVQENPSWVPSYRFLASCYAHLDKLDEARELIDRLRCITPVVVPSASHWRNPEHREFYLSGLRLPAGETT
jgi:hypothetical protein